MVSLNYLYLEKYEQLKKADTPFIIDLTVKAIPKGRPRASRHGHVYTPKRTRDFENYIRTCAATVERPPFTCPVRMTVVLREAIPSSFSGWKRVAAECNLICPPVGDLDNKVKAISDALNGIAFIDDSQIAATTASKQYANSNSIWVQIVRWGMSIQEIQDARRV